MATVMWTGLVVTVVIGRCSGDSESGGSDLVGGDR